MNAFAAPVRVMVVDDHPVVVDGVRMLLRSDSRVCVVGSAQTLREAMAQLRAVRPDVLLLDLRLPDMLASDAIRELRTILPGVKIVIFTAHGDHATHTEMLRAGVDGFLLKDVAGVDLTRALHCVAAGRRMVDPRLTPGAATRSDTQASRLRLTRREYEVLRLVATGKTNPEIGEELSLARNTVKAYLQSTLQKLGARNRVEAIARAQEEHIL